MVSTSDAQARAASESAAELAAAVATLSALADRGGALERGRVGSFNAAGATHEIASFRIVRPTSGQEPIRLGFFAGIHGDEAAGVLALVEFFSTLAAEPERATGYELWAYPVVNPTGCRVGTRANHHGKDLNREFWRGSAEPEVQLLEQELERRAFAGVISLHADDTCEGHYGYSHGHALDDALLRPALLAAERVLPRDRRQQIDGFSAREGVITECFQGILAPPPTHRPRPFNLIFETPAHAPMRLQVAANVAALDAIVSAYRGIIAYAQDI